MKLADRKADETDGECPGSSGTQVPASCESTDSKGDRVPPPRRGCGGAGESAVCGLLNSWSRRPRSDSVQQTSSRTPGVNWQSRSNAPT